MAEQNKSLLKSIHLHLEKEGIPFGPNDNLAEIVDENRLAAIRAELERLSGEMLDALLIDRRNHNVSGTPGRVARMLVDEVFAGRYRPAPHVTDFPNAGELDEAFVVGPITVRSACSHHLVPILGKAWVGVIPGERVIGLSKYHRLVEWIATRPQIQEEMTIQIADELERRCAPKGLAVVIRARHLCAAWRGVKDEFSEMTTSVMRGYFRVSEAARAEIMGLMRANGF